MTHWNLSEVRFKPEIHDRVWGNWYVNVVWLVCLLGQDSLAAISLWVTIQDSQHIQVEGWTKPSTVQFLLQVSLLNSTAMTVISVIFSKSINEA